MVGGSRRVQKNGTFAILPIRVAFLQTEASMGDRFVIYSKWNLRVFCIRCTISSLAFEWKIVIYRSLRGCKCQKLPRSIIPDKQHRPHITLIKSNQKTFQWKSNSFMVFSANLANSSMPHNIFTTRLTPLSRYDDVLDCFARVS